MGREATQFRKGQSGNPGGRPKRKPVTEAMTKALLKRAAKGDQTLAEQAAQAILDAWLAGDMTAAKLGLAYVEGTPPQAVELGGPDGGEIVIRRYVGVDVDAV